MLVEDSVETYAMRDRAVVTALEKGKLFGCGGREKADARMGARWVRGPLLIVFESSKIRRRARAEGDSLPD